MMRISLLVLLSFFFFGLTKAGTGDLQIIVHLKEEAKPEQVFKYPSNKQIHSGNLIEITNLKRLSAAMNIWEISLPNGMSFNDYKTFLKEEKNILAFEKTQRVYRSNFIPNDQLFPSQWNLRNTGPGGCTVGADIKCTEAWDNNPSIVNSRGDTIVIAVIDEPVDTSISQINWFVNKNEIYFLQKLYSIGP